MFGGDTSAEIIFRHLKNPAAQRKAGLVLGVNQEYCELDLISCELDLVRNGARIMSVLLSSQLLLNRRNQQQPG